MLTTQLTWHYIYIGVGIQYLIILPWHCFVEKYLQKLPPSLGLAGVASNRKGSISTVILGAQCVHLIIRKQ